MKSLVHSFHSMLVCIERYYTLLEGQYNAIEQLQQARET